MHKRVRNIFIVVSVFIALFALSGCDPNAPGESKTGAIELSLSNHVKSKGFKPGVSMEIASFEVIGSGPTESAEFGPLSAAGGILVVTDLLPGEWEITVTGYNDENLPIGRGVAIVTVYRGHTQKATVIVEEIGGVGSFELNLSYPEGIAEELVEEVRLTLYQEYTEPSTTSFTPDEPLIFAGLPSGFHALAVQLYGEDETMIWGNTYSLRVVQEQTTVGTITLTSEELALWGGLDLSIIDVMPVLFTVDLTASREQVGRDQSVTFTAKPSLSGGVYTYWWFVDGQRVEEQDGNTLTLADELELGRHNVSVVAIRAGVMASASQAIVKTDEGDASLGIQIRFTSNEDSSNILEAFLSAGLIGDLRTVGIEHFGTGIPVVSKIHDKYGKYQGAGIIASQEPIDLNNDIGMFRLGFTLEDVGKELLSISEIIFDLPDGLFSTTSEYSDVYLGSEADASLLTLTITKFGEVGDTIEGTVTSNNVPLVGYDDNDERHTLGSFTLEIQFVVEHIPECREYNLEEDSPSWATGLHPIEVSEIIGTHGSIHTSSGLLFLVPNVLDTPNTSDLSNQGEYSYEIIVQDRFGQRNDITLHLAEGEFSYFLPLVTYSNDEYRMEVLKYKNTEVVERWNPRVTVSANKPTILWLDYIQHFSSNEGALRNMKDDGGQVILRLEYPLSSSTGNELSGEDFTVENAYIDSISIDVFNGIYHHTLLVRSDLPAHSGSHQVRVASAETLLVDGKRHLPEMMFASFAIYPIDFDEVEHATYKNHLGTTLTSGLFYFPFSSEFLVEIDTGYAFGGWEAPNNYFFREQNPPIWRGFESNYNQILAPKPIIIPDNSLRVKEIYFDRELISHDGFPSWSFAQPLAVERLIIEFSKPVKSTTNDGAITTENIIITGASIQSIETDGNTICVTTDSFIKGNLTVELKDLESTTNDMLVGQTEFRNAVVEVSVVNDRPDQGIIDASIEGLYLNDEYFPVSVTPKPDYRISMMKVYYSTDDRSTQMGNTDYGELALFIRDTDLFAFDIRVEAEYRQRTP